MFKWIVLLVFEVFVMWGCGLIECGFGFCDMRVWFVWIYVGYWFVRLLWLCENYVDWVNGCLLFFEVFVMWECGLEYLYGLLIGLVFVMWECGLCKFIRVVDLWDFCDYVRMLLCECEFIDFVSFWLGMRKMVRDCSWSRWMCVYVLFLVLF